MSETFDTAEILSEIEEIDLGIIIFDSERRLEKRNEAAGLMLVEDSRLLSDDELRRLFFEDEKAHQPAGKPRTRRMFRLGKQVFGFSVYPLSGGRSCVLIRDITERLRLEALAEALESGKNLGYHFSSVRHELANPIGSIKMAAAVLRENLDRWDRQSVVEKLDTILAEVGRVEYLLHSLKTFRLLDQLRIEAIDAANFLARFVALVRDGFFARGIEIDTRLDPEIEILQADPRALHQILLNLMSNAADALEDRTAPRIEIRIDRIDGQVRIAVADNGCGIAEDRLNQIFQPFFTMKRGGTGLGLVIVRRLIVSMGGRIEVESQLGVGTTVWIHLPATGLAEAVREATLLLETDFAPRGIRKPER